ncbi:unnamed protein product [Allacma fusca]|uniref:F-box domain-containing protein n=1 Tax=Allacma fusca TaxID=39272 RepID=A0A8J2J375_9HEXA|nr:unnamed protein product [Allacma fusca]
MDSPLQLEYGKLELSDIINIDVIASEIFNIHRFTPKELVKCALVNKKWHSITRKVLQKKVNCTISLILKERREGSNMEKIRWLQNCCSRNFFNTIRVVIPQGSPHKCQHNYHNLLACLRSNPIVQTNFYAIEIDDDFKHDPSCQALQVIKQICQMLSSSTIEDLIVRNQNFDSVFRSKTGKYCFSNARFIKIRGMPQVPPDYFKVLKGYPHLQKVVAGVTMSSLPPFVSLEKTHLVSILSLVDLDNLVFDTLLQFAWQHPKLKAIIIHPSYFWFDPVMESIFSLLLDSSQESLETISTTLPVLGALTGAASCPLIGVQQIDINYLAGHFESESLNYIIASNMLPHLTTVEFTIDGILTIFDEVLDMDFNRVEDCNCPSVKNVIFFRFDQEEEELSGFSLETDVLRQVAQVFPNVKKFTYKGTVFPISEYEFRLTCQGIWWARWGSLETIEISVDYTDLVSFDTTILGITNEERAHWLDLLRLGVNLEDMQFAPCCKSIRDCPKLREILVHTDSSYSYEENSRGANLMTAKKHKPGWARLHPIIGPC